ncbi:MAG: L-fucokinase, partial [Acutalibacteraceae bacterium]
MKKISSQTDNCWDYAVVTVGTQSQKEMCELMCSAYKEKYPIKNLIFTADSDNDCRIGSGGALLNALDAVSQCAGSQSLTDKKILVINSGGMSKRAVNYALRGKIFANVSNDKNGGALSLFDICVSNASKLLPRFEAGVVVCCGDIPVRTDGEDIDFKTNVGFCVPAELSAASRHGVMIPDSDGFLARYPHKCEEAELKKIAQKYNFNDKLPVDTGTAYFCPEYVGALLKLIFEDSLLDYLKSNRLEMSLYPDVIDLMSKSAEEGAYLTSDDKIKVLLYKRLHGFLMRVCVLNDCEFLHYGTLSESVKNIQSDKTGAPYYFNSYVDPAASVGGGTV